MNFTKNDHFPYYFPKIFDFYVNEYYKEKMCFFTQLICIICKENCFIQGDSEFIINIWWGGRE